MRTTESALTLRACDKGIKSILFTFFSLQLFNSFDTESDEQM